MPLPSDPDTAALIPSQRHPFDMGERSHFHLLPVAEAALERLHAWGVGAVAATLARQTATLTERAAPYGFTALPARLRAGHYLGLRYLDTLPRELIPLLAERRVHISQRGDALRVTPHRYNTDQDVDHFFAALEACGVGAV